MSLREDPLLGTVRLCATCHEEWPFDPEFWHMRDGKLNPSWPARCIACCAEYYAARRRLAMTIEKAERAYLIPDTKRCGAEMRGDRRCSRRPGHRDGHRSREAVVYDAKRQRANRDPVAA